MPMLYGEGKKAFHRLQLEVIRTSNDQSIFAWSCNGFDGVRTGNILADDPSVFRCCSEMELMDPDEFIEYLPSWLMPETELPSTEDDRLGTFPVTNRGIQIWLFLFPIDQLALVPAFGRQRRAMLILVCWAMLILFLPGIVIRIKPQYLSDILKHFQFQSRKKINESNQISKHFSKYNLCSQSTYWSCSAWWPVLCAC